uniref:Uncharacterized protein n=1 Tax=Rousettus aegyptiacus TaxID=9407 RepID=A0A7J8GA39_ROUAE|nr:hypothetical protein HJG63_011477 [Rousettus aegyptiacus]
MDMKSWPSFLWLLVWHLETPQNQAQPAFSVLLIQIGRPKWPLPEQGVARVEGLLKCLRGNGCPQDHRPYYPKCRVQSPAEASSPPMSPREPIKAVLAVRGKPLPAVTSGSEAVKIEWSSPQGARHLELQDP